MTVDDESHPPIANPDGTVGESINEEPMSPEEYKQRLIQSLPDMLRFMQTRIKGWTPSKEQMLAAVETGYIVMKRTGDIRQAGKAVQDELNSLHQMGQQKTGTINQESLDETWSKKYKRSIDCSHPKGFSQKAHCAARRKRQAGGKTKSKSVSESQQIPENVLETLDFLMENHGLSNETAVSVVLESLDESLRDWFKEKWVRFGPDGKIRGACARGKSSEGKPKCLPQAKAHALGKKARAKAARRKRREDPNPDRKGKAHNVATKESTIYENAVEELAKKLKHHQEELQNCSKDTRYDKIDAIMQSIAKEHGITGHALHKDWMQVHHELPDDWVLSVSESLDSCPHCGGQLVSEAELQEKQDACYYKVRRRYKVWPSAYASGALVQCRKRGAKNWGNKSK